MERREFIVGKNLGTEDREDIQDHMREKRTFGRQIIKGELEKTSEVLYIIELFNTYVKKELEELGLADLFIEIYPEQIHLLPHEIYSKYDPDEKSAAYHNNLRDVVIIDNDKVRNRLELYKIILHESLHHFSHHKVKADKELKSLTAYRSGIANKQNFNGLNEGVLDLVVREILNKHKDELLDLLKVEEEEQTSPAFYYVPYMELVRLIISGIASHQNLEVSDVARKFKRSLFSGELMHLRDIDEVYGSGSLQILAKLGSRTHNPNDPLNKNIFEYFKTSDMERKEELKSLILVDEN